MTHWDIDNENIKPVLIQKKYIEVNPIFLCPAGCLIIKSADTAGIFGHPVDEKNE